MHFSDRRIAIDQVSTALAKIRWKWRRRGTGAFRRGIGSNPLDACSAEAYLQFVEIGDR
jgi:hypothetical protein